MFIKKLNAVKGVKIYQRNLLPCAQMWFIRNHTMATARRQCFESSELSLYCVEIKNEIDVFGTLLDSTRYLVVYIIYNILLKLSIINKSFVMKIISNLLFIIIL